jgi:uncharacterized protein (TIGR02270 family)
MPTAGRFVLDLLREHLEELDSLWSLRERVVFATDWYAADLAELEERAEAHLDALRIGGDSAVEVARPALTGDEPGAAMAAAFVLLERQSQPLADEVTAALREATPAVRDGIRIALRHGDAALAADRLYEYSTGRDVHLRAVVADVLAFRRLRQPPEVDRLLVDEDPAVARLGHRAAGRFGCLAPEAVTRALASEDPVLRRIVLEEAARAGVPNLLQTCRDAASRAAPRDAESVAFLGVVGDPADLTLLKRGMANPSIAPAALAGMGALGNVAAIPAILEAMTREPLARAAGDAFRRITGVDDLGRVDAAPPASDLAELDEDASRPLPDAAVARAAWDGVSARFGPDGRWQRGLDTAALDVSAADRLLPLAWRRDVVLRRRATDKQATPDVELERRVRA